MRTVLLLAAMWATAQAPSPSFDAASIKVNHSASNAIGGRFYTPEGGLSVRNAPLDYLISSAYGLPVTGLPAWASTTAYDVEAKPDHKVDSQTTMLMLQTLLAERFSLKAHRETVIVGGFHMVVDKGGSKLQTSDAPGIGFRRQQMGEIQGPGDMRMLALTLKAMVHAPVEDHTGITGKFDIHLTWTPDNGASAPGDGAAEPALSIFTAIRQQLGLSLEPAKISIERLAVDRVEKPTEN